MSNQMMGGVSEGAHRKIVTAYDMPETSQDVTRRTFMAKATITIGGIIGVILAIPIVGSLIPAGGGSKGTWSPLTTQEFGSLEKATDTPVKLEFSMKSKDSYLPEQSFGDYVWGIKVNPEKFKAARPDLPAALPFADGTYNVVNMSFVILSPICPHLGCRPIWSSDAKRFQCPCHGSQFSVDGEHLAGPAPRGMDPLPLREQSGIAQIMWIRYQSSVPSRVILSYES
ncbi:MAG: ubiquinol-cytochrome c reductase iron-sulfur subunit [Candidatus Eremiobacteraeota bacterium]|nr:ubiquinol-cytochrome c reductase iron-sulfur subunit [Candidatus Eremiobacteraeota bacterium]